MDCGQVFGGVESDEGQYIRGTLITRRVGERLIMAER